MPGRGFSNLVLALVLSMGFGATRAHAATSHGQPNPQRVLLTLYDEAGNPLPLTDFTISKGGQPIDCSNVPKGPCKTDRNGKFYVSPTETGKYEIYISSKPNERASLTFSKKTDGSWKWAIEPGAREKIWGMSPPAGEQREPTSGKIVDEEGNPFIGRFQIRGDGQPPIECETGRDGSFKVWLKETGRYQIVVADRAPIKAQVSETDKNAPWKFQPDPIKLPKPGAPGKPLLLAGGDQTTGVDLISKAPYCDLAPLDDTNPRKTVGEIVEDEKGQPLVGVDFKIWKVESGGEAEPSIPCRTEADGSFTIWGLKKTGDYQIEITNKTELGRIPAEVKGKEEDGAVWSFVKIVVQRSYTLRINPAHKAESEEQGWIIVIAGILALALAFQIRTYYMQGQMQNAANFSGRITGLKNSLETEIQNLQAREREFRAVRTGVDTAVRRDPLTEESAALVGAYEPEPGPSPSAPPPKTLPKILPPPEPLRPRSLVTDYEETRSAADSERAIRDFESRYSCTHLTLTNEKEVEINPKLAPEFEFSPRGWFLAVEQDGQTVCFPWFSLNYSQQTFRAAFDYQGTGPFRLTLPAQLSRGANGWVLAKRGRIESTV